LEGYIAKLFPAIETATPIAAPVVWLDFGIYYDSFEPKLPVNVSSQTFNERISEDYVCVRATLCEPFA
jgi:hypothetical protein